MKSPCASVLHVFSGLIKKVKCVFGFLCRVAANFRINWEKLKERSRESSKIGKRGRKTIRDYLMDCLGKELLRSALQVLQRSLVFSKT